LKKKDPDHQSDGDGFQEYYSQIESRAFLLSLLYFGIHAHRSRTGSIGKPMPRVPVAAFGAGENTLVGAQIASTVGEPALRLI
jgi:hypothetical protein